MCAQNRKTEIGIEPIIKAYGAFTLQVLNIKRCARELVPSRGIEPRLPVLQTGVRPIHQQGMEENVRVELTRAFQRVIVFETITNRLVLFSKWRAGRRIERPSFRTPSGSNRIADHLAVPPVKIGGVNRHRTCTCFHMRV